MTLILTEFGKKIEGFTTLAYSALGYTPETEMDQISDQHQIKIV